MAYSIVDLSSMDPEYVRASLQQLKRVDIHNSLFEIISGEFVIQIWAGSHPVNKWSLFCEPTHLMNSLLSYSSVEIYIIGKDDYFNDVLFVNRIEPKRDHRFYFFNWVDCFYGAVGKNIKIDMLIQIIVDCSRLNEAKLYQ